MKDTPQTRKVRLARIVALVLLFALALTIRLVYQNESEVDVPLRADAGKYFLTAFNLQRYGVYSAENTLVTRRPPKTESGNPPGYPLFLYPFVASSDNFDPFIVKVTTFQALLGAIAVVMTFFLAYACVGFRWAIGAACLTALCPHLVAADGFVLTESLFTFTMMLGVLAFVSARRARRAWLGGVAGVILGLCALIRPSALLLGVALLPAYCLHLLSRDRNVRRSGMALAAWFIGGYLAICSPYFLLKDKMITGEHSAGSQYQWQLALGSDAGLPDLVGAQDRLKTPEMMNQMASDPWFGAKVVKRKLSERPWETIHWYLVGKALYLWKWDSYYAEDVYLYPMNRKGFEENMGLKVIHRLMRALHWPLFAAAAGCPVLLLVYWRRKLLEQRLWVALCPILVCAYHFLLHSVFIPLPRYGIPLRPFMFCLAVFFLAEITRRLPSANDPAR